MQELAERTILITGASRGIGRVLAVELAARGARICCSARNATELEAVVATITEAGGQAFGQAADVTCPEQVQELFARIRQEWNCLDAAIINAGGHLFNSSLLDSDAVAWKQVIDLNLFGAYLCMKEAATLMLPQAEGQIIAMGSGNGRQPAPNKSAYCCAKAGLSMLVRVLATEVRPHGICVNEFIPGSVDPPDRPASEAMIAQSARVHEWRKTPEDLLPLLMMLVQQPPHGPTGQCFSLLRRPII